MYNVRVSIDHGPSNRAGLVVGTSQRSKIQAGGVDLRGPRFTAAEIDYELGRLIKDLQSHRQAKQGLDDSTASKGPGLYGHAVSVQLDCF